MKTLGAFVLTAVFGLTAFSQDTLYTTRGKTINGRVTEITQNEIKYKKASNPDGPVYVMDKSDVVLIHYKNGTKEVFENSSAPANDNTAVNNNQNNNDQDPVYATQQSNVNVVIGGGYGGWGGGYGGWGAGYYGSGFGWGWGGWGWNRPYYGGGYGYSRWYGGGYRHGYRGYRGGYGGYHNYGGGWHGGGGHFGGGGGHFGGGGGGHFGHHGGGHR